MLILSTTWPMKIKESAFENCTSLENIELNHVTDIEIRTFKGCTSIMNIDI